MQETHRPSHLKQINKSHKHGRHRSKGEINANNNGKTSLSVISRKVSKQNKYDRRHQANQMRTKKRESILLKKREIGGLNTAPILVSVVPLGFDTVPEKFIDMLLESNIGSLSSSGSENIFNLTSSKLNQRFSFILTPKGSLYATLDSVKVSDAVVFLLSAENSLILDDSSEKLLSILVAHGCPAASFAIMDCNSKNRQKRWALKQLVQKLTARIFPHEKIMSLETTEDLQALMRMLGSQKNMPVKIRANHSYLLAERVVAVADSSDSGVTTVKISGYLRGRGLSANELVHIPGWGDFQIAQIDASSDSFTIANEDDEDEVLQLADPKKQIDLVTQNEPDPMHCEQTWPTDQELEQATNNMPNLALKGTSDYQACWIPDAEGHSIDFDDGDIVQDGDSYEDMECNEKSENDEEWEEKDDEIVNDEVMLPPEKYDKTIDIDEEGSLLEKLRAAGDEAAFPDEMDTPQDISARLRFSKYRGLASFRTSPWDPKENLPINYSKIFQFENFDRTKRRIMKQLDEDIDGVPPGGYITLHVRNVPKQLIEERPLDEPVVVFGLLPHEHKMSLVHFLVQRSNCSTMRHVPIKSKEPVVIHCGFRRYVVKPIYSQHTNGFKHKHERFFQPDATVVASAYAPIVYPPAPVLMFNESGLSLLATGRVLSVDPDRLNIKRVVLSGHPFRVLKHSAIVRFMFFNREDIEWFKPIELHTKYGRRGHIKEPLGTHGHMKVVFDDQLKSQDTVLMALYKRVFPPWHYLPTGPKSPNFYKVMPVMPLKTSMEL